MPYLRSVLFILIYYPYLIFIMLICSPLLLLDVKYLKIPFKIYAEISYFLFKAILGITHEVRGIENLPQTPSLIAIKHQSAWETLMLMDIIPNSVTILKKDLTYIPLFGWYLIKFGCIAIDRKASTKAMRKLLTDTKTAINNNKNIIIFPEGTRKEVNAKPDYKPGVVGIYKNLNSKCVPVALNSGLYWPRRNFIKNQGNIVVEILNPIDAGLDRRKFMDELISKIETASTKLANPKLNI